MVTTKEEIEQFIMGYLLTDHGADDIRALNFVDSGLLDSFGILSMVIDIENRFSVKLSPEILLKPEAKTAQGLASLVTDEIDRHE